MSCLARQATRTGAGEEGQEKGLEEDEESGEEKMIRIHLEEELDDLYSLAGKEDKMLG